MTRKDCYTRIVGLISDKEKTACLSDEDLSEAKEKFKMLPALLNNIDIETDSDFKRLAESHFDITARRICVIFERSK